MNTQKISTPKKISYRLILALKMTICLLVFSGFLSEQSRAENWKGNTVSPPYEVGGLIGMNLFGDSVNWSILGTGAYLIVPQGWVEDIDERVWAEMELGPSFFSAAGITKTGLQYSAHLRWDFTMNESWNFYALGGLGGYSLPQGFGGHLTVAPRFGLGAQYQSKIPMMFRGEISHEFIGVGLSFNF